MNSHTSNDKRTQKTGLFCMFLLIYLILYMEHLVNPDIQQPRLPRLNCFAHIRRRWCHKWWCQTWCPGDIILCTCRDVVYVSSTYVPRFPLDCFYGCDCEGQIQEQPRDRQHNGNDDDDDVHSPYLNNTAWHCITTHSHSPILSSETLIKAIYAKTRLTNCKKKRRLQSPWCME